MKTYKKALLSALCLAAAGGIMQAETWKYVAASDGTTYAIKSDGTLWSWGWNESGQLGTNGVLTGETGQSKDYTAIPQLMNDASDWVWAFGGKANGFFLKEDGTLWSVGSNAKGALGTSSTLDSKVLKQIGEFGDWKTLSASHFYGYTVIAIRTDGTLWTWGEGENGANGTGKYYNSSEPVQVGTDTDWASISVGNSHALAIKNDGTLWAWGANFHHQVGVESTSLSDTKLPQCISTDTDWEQVYAVAEASYAIKKDGSLWAWGSNEKNILGLNLSDDEGYINADEELTWPDIEKPTRILADLGKIVTINGDETTRVVGVGEPGAIAKIYAWGSNADGALGNGKGEAWGTGSYYINPKAQEVPVPEVAFPVKMITCGQGYSIVLGNNDKLYGWGRNRNGQLGDYGEQDKLSFYKSPIEVGVKGSSENDFTFGADNIPAKLSSAEHITLTGEWKTSDFGKLTQAIGNNMGFPPQGNSTITTIDMSQVTFPEEVSFYVSAGLSNKGVFNGLKALTTVVMPKAEEAAKITSIREAFSNCGALANIEIDNLVNCTDWTDAFNNCTSIVSMDLSTINFINKSEAMLNGCTSLTKVILPALINFNRQTLGNCTALRTIDWSEFIGTEAPAFDDNLFQGMDDILSEIELIVPDEKADLFRNHAGWSQLKIVALKAPTAVSDIAQFIALGKEGTSVDVYTFSNPVTVELQYAENLWVADASGVLRITDRANNWSGAKYKEGDRISGFSLYFGEDNGVPVGLAESTIETFGAATAGDILTPETITLSDLNASLDARLVKLDKVVVALSGGQSKIKDSDILVNYLTNTANLSAWARLVAAGSTVDLSGVVYNAPEGLTIMTTAMEENSGIASIVEGELIAGAEGRVICPAGARVFTVAGAETVDTGLAAGVYVVVYKNRAVKVVVR